MRLQVFITASELSSVHVQSDETVGMFWIVVSELGRRYSFLLESDSLGVTSETTRPHVHENKPGRIIVTCPIRGNKRETFVADPSCYTLIMNRRQDKTVWNDDSMNDLSLIHI